MLKWIAAPLAATIVLGASSIASAQEAAPAAAPDAKPAAEAQAPRRGGAGAWGGRQMTTATIEQGFARRIASWEAAKIPAEKIAKAKEILPKIKAALESGNTEEARTLNRSVMELLTPEERQAIAAQGRANRRGPGAGDGATSGPAMRGRGGNTAK